MSGEGKPDLGTYYDAFWGGTDAAARSEHNYRDFQSDLLAYVDSLLGDLHGQRILELGPGLGFDTVRLLERGAEVLAIDLSQTSLDVVRERCAAVRPGGRLQLLRMNAERLALSDGYFDLVYVRCILMHAEWRQVVRECHRVLRPGGRIVVVEPLRHHPLVALYRATLSYCKGSRPAYLAWSDLRRIGRLFRLMERRPFYLFSPVALELRCLPLAGPLRRVLQALDRGLLRLTPLQPFAWYGVALYER